MLFITVLMIIFESNSELCKTRLYSLCWEDISNKEYIINLIKAFEMLVRNEKFALKLKLTGSHSDLNFKIDEKVRNQIEFISNVSDKELVDLYKHARLLAFPSLCEGFGFLASGGDGVRLSGGNIPCGESTRGLW